jgi:hypothetical protein
MSLDPVAVRREMELTSAFARWATGTPVFYAEYGRPLPQSPSAADLEAQASYYDSLLSAWRSSCADGAVAWWWPGGWRTDEQSDFGLTEADGSPRPALDVLSSWSAATSGPCTHPAATVAHTFEPVAGVRGEADVFAAARPRAQQAIDTGARLVFRAAAEDATSLTAPRWIGDRCCGTRDLWAEIHQVELRVGASGAWFEVEPGRAYGVAAGQPIHLRARVRNLGPATWLPDNVFFATNPAFGGVTMPWWRIPQSVPRLGELAVPEADGSDVAISSGLAAGVHHVQFQLVADGVAWISGAFPIDLVAY